MKKTKVSFKEAISYLEISPSSLYKMTSRRVIPFSKPNGGKIYFDKSDLDNWMMRNRFETINEKEKVLTKLNINIKNDSK